jgi:acyl-CoA reductase-like NAD-dependent aldehyde dehydrogenase
MADRAEVKAFIGGEDISLDEAAVERAVAGVAAVLAETRRLSSYDKAGILDRVILALKADAEALVDAMTDESGCLTRRDMVLELERTIEVFSLSAAVVREGIEGRVNLDAALRGRDATGIVKAEPIGPILGITAFNGPMLIAAHKIAPAIVAGCPIIIKPSPRVPRSAVLLARQVVKAGWPCAALAVLPLDNDATMTLIHDPRLPLITFTGGAVGWTIKDAVPRKRVHLELGGVGAVIVAADADLEMAAEQCTAGGFVRSGQACLAVQRIYVERPAYERFAALITARVAALVTGDPRHPKTEVGPLVDEAAARRVEALIVDATDKGARLLCGGTRAGALVQPAVLADVTPDMRLMRTEAFGPVVALAPVDSMAEAVAETNAVDGAIHVGIYTNDLDLALTIADRVRAGGVIINGPSAWRVDQMPYGGTGTSGFGREGVRAMVAEYTEPKVLVIRHRPRDLGLT